MNHLAVGTPLRVESLFHHGSSVLLIISLVAIVVILLASIMAFFRWRKRMRSVDRPDNISLSAVSEEREKAILSRPPEAQNGLQWGASKDDAGGSSLGAEHGGAPSQAKTILIADDDPVVVLALSQRLQRLGYHVFRTPDATHALLGIKKIHPDLVILDIQMPAGNGLAVCEMLACDRECVNIPIIVHSVLADESVKKRCEHFGTRFVEKSPRSWEQIKALVDSLLGEDKGAVPELAGEEEVVPEPNAPTPSVPESQTHKEVSPEAESPAATVEAPGSATEAWSPLPTVEADAAANASPKMVVPLDRQLLTILCIDDDPVITRSIALRLHPYGIKVKGVENGTQGYLQAISEHPDIILLDLKMPNGAGDYVLSKLKDNPHTQNIPVVVLTMEKTAGVRRKMCALGAEDYVTKPVHWPNLFAAIGRCIQLPPQLLMDYNLPEQLTIHEI